MKVIFNIFKILLGIILFISSIMSLMEELNNTTPAGFFGALIACVIFLVISYLLVNSGLKSFTKENQGKIKS
ncbi:hypothetical protein [Sphingobacterium sp. BN32]|uniref:hypothetical protein n=1 Tax=Sphingobacterium sp. BN32 TaxID=3058432 RepID=UPI00265D0805|nr:hypothetical protein [Sphingobacterium sp. BN32]WKK59675.1 hypothetical protein QYC40_05420 [Sphingobacterium sp. BN32]